jgi:hypothetical protein
MDELRADDPRWIGAYRLMGRLGVGGMGRVYLARSERGRTVAVKLVRPDLAEREEFRGRFRREVRAARRVGGRWTAPVLDADTEADVPWVATGYVPGPSLQQVVAKDFGPLPESSVRVLAAGLAYALADIHGAGLVHRDLKPSNVMITIDGPRVIDFGIARALETVTDASLTGTGAMVGSPAFMSPEQVRGDRVTPACDVFCLGSVLAYAATGLQPFGAASSGVHAQMYRIVQEPPDLEAVPEGLRALVAGCLAKDPQDRPSLAGVHELLGADGADGADGEGADDEDGIGAGPGAGADYRGGEPWLPGAIVAQLGRHAVRLLELESEAEEPRAAGDAPTVVTRTAVGGQAVPTPRETATGTPAAPAIPTEPAGEALPAAETSTPSAAEAFPAAETFPTPEAEPFTAPVAETFTTPTAEPSATPAADPLTGTAPGPWEGTGTGPHVAPAGPARPLPPTPYSPGSTLPPPRGPMPPPGTPGPPNGPGGFAPTERRGRGRLITAVVALVVVAGGATAYVTLHKGTSDHPGPGPHPPTSTRPPTGTPTNAPTAAGLKDMLGTWRTSFTSDDNGDNTRTLTVRANGTVELSGDSATYACFWEMHVTSSGPPVGLSPSKVVSGTPASSCAPGDATTLTLLDPTHLRRADVDDGKAPLTYTKVAG